MSLEARLKKFPKVKRLDEDHISIPTDVAISLMLTTLSNIEKRQEEIIVLLKEIKDLIKV